MKAEKAPLAMDRGCEGCIRECVYNRPRLAEDNYEEEKYPCNNYRKDKKWST